MNHDVTTAEPLTLEARRADLARRFLTPMTPEEAREHRRLVNTGRFVEARAMVARTEQAFRSARHAFGVMLDDDLLAFERALQRGDRTQMTRVVAEALLREERQHSADAAAGAENA